MLREFPASQHRGEPRRRWFSDDYFDLIVWLDEETAIIGFQLCYDKKRHEHSLTWTQAGGCRHDAIDDGEVAAPKKQSPLLFAAGDFPAHEVRERFRAASAGIAAEIRSFILDKLGSW